MESMPRKMPSGWKVIDSPRRKGDDDRPNYRSRLVGKEFAREIFEADTFAATPLIGAPRATQFPTSSTTGQKGKMLVRATRKSTRTRSLSELTCSLRRWQGTCSPAYWSFGCLGKDR